MKPEAQLGLELDPLNSFSQCFYVGQLMYMNQYDEALLQLDKILSLESNFPFVHRYLWICYHQKQMYDDAIKAARDFFSAVNKKEFSDTINQGYANKDYKEAMHLLAKSMEQHSKSSYVQSVWIARLYAHAGDKEPALNWLETAYKERDSLMTNLNTSSDWIILHEEERFKELVMLMNFPH